MDVRLVRRGNGRRWRVEDYGVVFGVGEYGLRGGDVEIHGGTYLAEYFLFRIVPGVVAFATCLGSRRCSRILLKKGIADSTDLVGECGERGVF